ncbi:hypothetical protein F383_05936 [Gossypium arboreum]|uniref:Uncharacterized protein n=1 Tax=Gossypium arboreum TaxID=29729 RepID=A0A0B0N8Z6_GOSAR|nr:hypothetical protein F383_36529 [Gossypium arboreum]KHG25303.1 hypothetical protein F383_05936 [Gossypium arboreum]
MPEALQTCNINCL